MRLKIVRGTNDKYKLPRYDSLDHGGKFSYVNAAHCPPIVVRADATQTELEATGMPVGLVETAEFAVAEHQLAPGDKVVVYSDGVTEAQNASGDFFGKKRTQP